MLSDSYVEQAVKSKPAASFYGKMAVSVLVLLIGVALVLFTLLGILVFAAGIAMLVYFSAEKKIEYEYILTNGSVEIAAIYNASRRKKIFEFELEQVSMVVPKDSARIQNETFKKKRDYTSKSAEAQVVCLVLDKESGKVLVSLEPNDKVMAHIRTYARHKVYDL